MADLAQRLRMTDVRAWPKPVAELALSMPWASIPVRPAPGGGFCPVGEVPVTAPLDLMPKLGPKSWQETGRLRIIREGQPLGRAVAGLLNTPRRQQMTVLTAGWPESEEDAEDELARPIHLHLFEALDFSGLSECRCLWSGGRMRMTSHCQRSRVKVRTEALKDSCALIADAMPGLGTLIAQFALVPWRAPALVDLNPGLDAADLAAINALSEPAA